MRKLLLRIAPVFALTMLLGASNVAVGCASPTDSGGENCCRVCRTGKACGDSCISRSSTCHQGSGCACNG